MGKVVWFSTLLILMISCQGIGAFVGGDREAAWPGGDDQKNDQNITPATSQQLLDSFHLLIVKALNDMENRMEDKLLQLQNVVNDKTSLLKNGLHGKIDMLTKNFHDKFDALENRMEDRFKSTDEKLIFLQVHLSSRKDSLDCKIDDKLGQLHRNFTKERDTSQEKADVKLQTLQNNVDTRIGTLENYINDRLDTLGERLEDKLDNNSLQLNDKISQKLANYSTDSKTNIINSLESFMQKSQEEQKTTLGNLSEDVDMNMNKTLHFLARIESSFEACKKTDDLFDYKNQTREILDALASINSTKCQHFEELPVRPHSTNCYRGMAYDATKRYQRRELLRDNTLDRDILCDTQTDGGGWIVIQSRTKGDVDFYKNWAEYKHGFGTPPGDFWLGNEAIYELTNRDAYELRIDFNDGTQDLFAVYSSFKLESEDCNYRLRLGSHSGTLGEKNTGLSYHNGMEFTTYDRDNDDWSGGNCAEKWHGAWWHNVCHTSNLNGLWGDRSAKGLWWHTGSVYVYAKSTEIKIRRV